MNKFLFGHKFHFSCVCTQDWKVSGDCVLCVELSNCFSKWLNYFAFPSDVDDCSNLPTLSPLLSF